MKKIALVLMVMGFMFGLTQYTQTLVTPGVTSIVNVNGNISHTFVYKISGVSTNVIYAPQASLDMANWFNVFPTNNIWSTTNSVVTYDVKSTTPFFGVRLNWLSKLGAGTTPNIVFQYMGSKY
jgi:hypothetical protein